MTTTKIPAEFLEAITGSEITDGGIGTADIADGAITTAKLAANAINATKLPDNVITATHIPDGLITGTHLANSTVTQAKIADNSIGTDQLAGIARGKIIYGDANGDPQLLTLGSNGTVLKSDGTDISWGAESTFDTDAAQVFNESGAAVDFRIEGDTEQNLFFVDGSADRIGIGDATPQALLDVGGGYGSNTSVATFAHATDAYIEIENMTTQNGAGIILTNAGTKKWTIQKDTSAHHLTIQDTSGDVMTFLQGGNVGINTTSPSTLLHLGGTAPGDSIIRQDSTSSGTNWEIGERAAGKWQIFEDDGDSIVATFMSTGRLGLGTESPSYELHVQDDASETTIAVQSNVGGSGSAVGGRLRLQLGAQSNSGSGNADTQAGDTLGQIMFEGQGTDYSYQGGNIKTIVTVGDGDDGRSNQATAMTFETLAVGSVSPAENFRITEQGTIGMPGTGSGNFAGGLLINHDGSTGTLNNAYYNTGFGYEVFDKITSGDNNTAIGNQAAYDLTTGSANSLFGRLAGANVNSGNYNTLGGYQSGDAVTDGQHNTAWGYEALGAHNGSYNTAIGDRALHANTGGNSNTAVGSAAMFGSSNSAEQNTAVGANSMEGITTGQGNATLGHYAGYALTSGSYNVAVGRRALMGTCTGTFNIALGYEAMMNVSSGSENICLGRDAGHDITTGNQNVAVGHESLTKITSASQCAALGFQALEKATAHSNVGVGYKAGENITSGTNNIMIGKNSGHSSSPIGALSTGSNNICLGDDNIASLFCTQSTINTSDRRDKADITNFTGGLDFVKKMQPVTYKWDRRSWYLPKDEDGNFTDDDITKVTRDGSKKENVTHVGFIAQDVETLEKEIGFADDNTNRLLTNLTDDGNRYGIKYERIVTVLVNAVKELDTKLAAAEARIKTLEG